MEPTTRLGLDVPQVTDNVSAGPADFAEAEGILDSAELWTQSSSAPASAPGNEPGNLWTPTGTNSLKWNAGSAASPKWLSVGGGLTVTSQSGTYNAQDGDLVEGASTVVLPSPAGPDERIGVIYPAAETTVIQAATGMLIPELPPTTSITVCSSFLAPGSSYDESPGVLVFQSIGAAGAWQLVSGQFESGWLAPSSYYGSAAGLSGDMPAIRYVGGRAELRGTINIPSGSASAWEPLCFLPAQPVTPIGTVPALSGLRHGIVAVNLLTSGPGVTAQFSLSSGAVVIEVGVALGVDNEVFLDGVTFQVR